MSWLTSFLLGRPGYEVSFDVPPEAITIEDQQIAVVHTNIAGYKKKSIINPSMPTIKLSSKYLTQSQRNALASLAMIDDTFLSFQCRDDFQIISQKIVPLTVNQIVLPSMSCVRLSQALAVAGFSGIITVNSVYETATPTAGELYGEGGFGDGGYDGPNFYDGGSYDDASKTIQLGTSLSSLNAVYVSFTFKGWLVNMDKFSSAQNGQNIDWFSYDIQLSGA